MATDPTQRAYRAPRPGCGAPVEFKVPSPPMPCAATAKARWCAAATCSRAWARWPSCSTTTARCSFLPAGASPSMARSSLHPDRPPAVQKRCRRVDGVGGLSGRRQHRQPGEDNGAYVFTRKIDPGRELPEASRFRLGPPPPSTARATALPTAAVRSWCRPRANCPNCRRWANRLTWWSCAAPMARCSASTTATPASVERGRSVLLEDLAAGPQRRIGQGRKRPAVQLPALRRTGAGAAVHHQSLTCGSCNSLIDLNSGVGGELRAAVQTSPCSPSSRWQQRPVAGRALAGGGLSAPHGRGARRR